jgi:hypothetical protein
MVVADSAQSAAGPGHAAVDPVQVVHALKMPSWIRSSIGQSANPSLRSR